MRELVAPQAAERALLFLAVIGPLAGLIVGVVIGAHERCAWPKIVAGALIGAVFTVVYGMWRLYGVVTDALGLDSVANLVLELAMFAVVGSLLGLAALRITLLLKRRV